MRAVRPRASPTRVFVASSERAGDHDGPAGSREPTVMMSGTVSGWQMAFRPMPRSHSRGRVSSATTPSLPGERVTPSCQERNISSFVRSSICLLSGFPPEWPALVS
jgi:hypothetical protein